MSARERAETSVDGRPRPRWRAFGKDAARHYTRRPRGVAQPGSAPALGAGGRRFKSGRPDTWWRLGRQTRRGCERRSTSPVGPSPIAGRAGAPGVRSRRPPSDATSCWVSSAAAAWRPCTPPASRGSVALVTRHRSLAEFGGVMEGLLAGLAHAERHNVVHRDLKPENLLMCSPRSHGAVPRAERWKCRPHGASVARRTGWTRRPRIDGAAR
jgi:hypothetical protein